MGVRESGITEDILVYAKVAILVIVAGAGLLTVDPAETFPVFEKGGGGAITTAALIFVAFEGFQLLTYDYDDIADHRRNLPRAIYISIPAVAVIYMLVAFATTGSLADGVISRHSETVLATPRAPSSDASASPPSSSPPCSPPRPPSTPPSSLPHASPGVSPTTASSPR